MAGMKFRPRFSVRTLAIVVTLVCLYFGAWDLTKRRGIPDQTVEMPGYIVHQPTTGRLIHIKDSGVAAVVTAGSPAPFAIWTEELLVDEKTGNIKHVRRHYVWLLGPMIKLPVESEVK